MEYLIIILILLIIHPYIIYPLILTLLNKGIGRTNKLSEYNQHDYPKVSVLIAAYNEEKVISDKIINTLNLDYPTEKLQIVVGSDGSQDNTNDIVASFAKKYPQIILLDFKDRAGKANIINKSIIYCEGEIIVLSDANAMYNKLAIKNIVKNFSDSNVGCVAGEKRMSITDGQDSIGQNEGLYWKLESYIKAQESILFTVIGADGALYAIRRELFRPLPENTSVDDFLLSMLIVSQGYKIKYEPNAYSYEFSGETLSVEYRRKVRIAAGNFNNLKHLKKFMGFKLVSFMFISHKLLRWVSPFIFIFLSCLLLIRESPVNKFGFIILSLSYLLAMLGYIYQNTLFGKMKVVSIVTHFYLTVLAQLQGLIKFLTGIQKATWDTARK